MKRGRTACYATTNDRYATLPHQATPTHISIGRLVATPAALCPWPSQRAPCSENPLRQTPRAVAAAAPSWAVPPGTVGTVVSWSASNGHWWVCAAACAQRQEGPVPILNGKEIQPALASSTRRIHACARTTGFLACTHLTDRCHEQARVGKPGQPRDWQSVAWYFAPRLQLQQPRSQILQPRRERTLRWPRQLHPRQWHLPEREGGLNGTHGFGAKLAALQSGAKLAGQKNKHRRSRFCWLMPPSPAIVL